MSDKAPSKPDPEDPQSARQRRLAEALRANLKRRKAAKRPEKDPSAP